MISRAELQAHISLHFQGEEDHLLAIEKLIMQTVEDSRGEVRAVTYTSGSAALLQDRTPWRLKQRLQALGYTVTVQSAPGQPGWDLQISW